MYSKTAIISILFFILLTGTACQGSETPADEMISPVASSSPTADPADQSKQWDNWQKSPHAKTYDLGKGPNTYCSQCHSPRNWDPQAVIDPPPNCVSCKFAFEDEPRIAAGNPLVPINEWVDIRCDVCHQVDKGVADPLPVWWDQEAGQYVPVAGATEQCEKCHTDTETIRHRRELGDDAHADFECTECHDAHSVAASCANEACHAAVDADNVTADAALAEAAEEAAITMHSAEHTAVDCIACHDASGLEVGPLEEGGRWTTWRTTELLGRTNTNPYQSHAVGLEVNCQRCHFEGNPWNLEVVDSPDSVQE